MVISNLDDVPSIRIDHGGMFGNQTLRPVINFVKSKGFLSGDAKKWWEACCEHIRNKICHGDLLHILDDCRKCSDEVANQGISPHIVPGLGISLIILLHKRLFV